MLANWHEQFPGCEPVAHELRTAFLSRWVRFHSLPESKRYPEDEDDVMTVLARWNRVLEELIGQEARVVLITTEYSGTADPSSARRRLSTFDPDAKPWRRIPPADLGGCSMNVSYWHIFASEWEWRPSAFDAILRLVADDMISNVMVVDPHGRWLFHPYDGGMDVILESPAARDRLRSLHTDWLSPRPDGL